MFLGNTILVFLSFSIIADVPLVPNTLKYSAEWNVAYVKFKVPPPQPFSPVHSPFSAPLSLPLCTVGL